MAKITPTKTASKGPLNVIARGCAAVASVAVDPLAGEDAAARLSEVLGRPVSAAEAKDVLDVIMLLALALEVPGEVGTIARRARGYESAATRAQALAHVCETLIEMVHRLDANERSDATDQGNLRFIGDLSETLLGELAPFSNPLTIALRDRTALAKKIVRLARHGATGAGLADKLTGDTGAVRRALHRSR